MWCFRDFTPRVSFSFNQRLTVTSGGLKVRNLPPQQTRGTGCPLLFHSPLQMDSASELPHCSMSWLQLSTMLSSWDLSQETPRKRANCSTRFPGSCRRENRGKGEVWTQIDQRNRLLLEFLNNTEVLILLPQTASTHGRGGHSVLSLHNLV